VPPGAAPLRELLPGARYKGLIRVTPGDGGPARWLPISVPGLATVDNGCGDGGRNALFRFADSDTAF